MYKYVNLPRRIAFASLLLLLGAITLSVPVKAQILTANPGTIFFGDMSIHQSGITRELRIENTGEVSLQISGIEITGQHAAHFSIVSGTEPGTISDPIRPGASALFLVRATPTPHLSQVVKAQIEITSDGGNVSIPLFTTVREPRTFYVSPAGSNNNPGTRALPWRTIQYAVGHAVPKDTFYVEDGLYEGPVIMSRSGEPDAYITLKAVNKWGAKIEVVDGEGQQDGIKISASYITVDGFEIYDPNPGPGHYGNGITIYQAHHVNALNNKVYDFGGSGIQGAYCDHVLIENNVVYDNAKYNPNQSSGISIWKPWAVDDAPGYHLIIRNNRSFGNTTITKNERGINTDGTGIIIDRSWESKEGQRYPHRTLIENNLVYDNGGSGIHIYKSSHIDVFNNTAYHNRHNEGITGTFRGDLYSNRSSDTVWRNNIAVANPGSGITEHNRAIFANRAEDAIYENNITYSTDPNNTHSLRIIHSDFSQDELLATNLIGVNPQFKDPVQRDFSLQPYSLAINAGNENVISTTDINYLTRTLDQIDIGAFEYFDVAFQVELTSFESLVAGQDIQLRWTTASELNNAGFVVELRAQEQDFEQVRFVKGHGTTNSERVYETTLLNLDYGSYDLRLKKIGVDGTVAFSEALEVIIDAHLPVELTAFQVLVANRGLQISWITAAEVNNAGFSIELQTQDQDFEEIFFVKGQGTSDSEQTYEQTFQDVLPGAYALRLKQIDFDGSFAYSEIIEVTVAADAFQLAQNYPNPFNPQSQIPYTLPVRSHVVLEVFDLLGRHIRTVVNEEQLAGAYTALFDAHDLSNGTYVYRLTAGTYTETRTMVLLK